MPSKEWEKLDESDKNTIEAHQLEAPVKVSSLARALGVEVKGATLPPGISGEIRPNRSNRQQFIVRINRHDPSRRQRFTAAHELAHFLLHQSEIGDGISDDVLYRSSLSDRREAEANRLAADILMPENLVQEALNAARLIEVDDVVGYLADRFEVSEAAMRIRLGIK